MSKTSMHASLKAKHKKHACLPPTHPSSTWKGNATRPVPEVARQCEPSGSEPTSRHQNMATEGGVEAIPRK